MILLYIRSLFKRSLLYFITCLALAKFKSLKQMNHNFRRPRSASTTTRTSSTSVAGPSAAPPRSAPRSPLTPSPSARRSPSQGDSDEEHDDDALRRAILAAPPPSPPSIGSPPFSTPTEEEDRIGKIFCDSNSKQLVMHCLFRTSKPRKFSEMLGENLLLNSCSSRKHRLRNLKSCYSFHLKTSRARQCK